LVTTGATYSVLAKLRLAGGSLGDMEMDILSETELQRERRSHAYGDKRWGDPY